MTMASGYSLDLYCDIDTKDCTIHPYNCFPHQFTGETFSECKRDAINRGWKFKRDGTHICPAHDKKGSSGEGNWKLNGIEHDHPKVNLCCRKEIKRQ